MTESKPCAHRRSAADMSDASSDVDQAAWDNDDDDGWAAEEAEGWLAQVARVAEILGQPQAVVSALLKRHTEEELLTKWWMADDSPTAILQEAGLDVHVINKEATPKKVARLPPPPQAEVGSPRLPDYRPGDVDAGESLVLNPLREDELVRLLALLELDDMLATALACRKLRVAVFALRPILPGRARRLQSPIAATALASIARLEWSLAIGCPSLDICALAARRGSLELLQRARQLGCPWGLSVTANAVEGGYAELMLWAVQNGCSWSSLTLQKAASCQNFSLLRAAVEAGCPCDHGAAEAVAATGNRQELEWLRSRGCPWGVCTFSSAAWSGSIQLVQWMREQGCPWASPGNPNPSSANIAAAAAGGHIGMLEWLRDAGCPWANDHCAAAALNGHLGALQWLRRHGCPWGQGTCRAARVMGSTEVLNWALSNGAPEDLDGE